MVLLRTAAFPSLQELRLEFEWPTQANLVSASIRCLATPFLIRTVRGMEGFRYLLRGPLFRFRLLQC